MQTPARPNKRKANDNIGETPSQRRKRLLREQVTQLQSQTPLPPDKNAFQGNGLGLELRSRDPHTTRTRKAWDLTTGVSTTATHNFASGLFSEGSTTTKKRKVSSTRHYPSGNLESAPDTLVPSTPSRGRSLQKSSKSDILTHPPVEPVREAPGRPPDGPWIDSNDRNRIPVALLHQWSFLYTSTASLFQGKEAVLKSELSKAWQFVQDQKNEDILLDSESRRQLLLEELDSLAKKNDELMHFLRSNDQELSGYLSLTSDPASNHHTEALKAGVERFVQSVERLMTERSERTCAIYQTLRELDELTRSTAHDRMKAAEDELECWELVKARLGGTPAVVGMPPLQED